MKAVLNRRYNDDVQQLMFVGLASVGMRRQHAEMKFIYHLRSKNHELVIG